MNEEEMREAWRELSGRVDRLELSLMRESKGVISTRAQSALETLAAKYRRFAVFGMICAILSPFYSQLPALADSYRLLIGIYMTLYFAMASVIDWWLYAQVTDIDVTRMSVSEVYRRARRCRKVHLRSIMLLLPMAIGLVVLFIFAFGHQPWITGGIVTGVVVGMAIGSIALIQFMRDYRKISEE